jgi:FkbM family methyltransferase
MILDKIESGILAYRRWYTNRAQGAWGDWHREDGVGQFWRNLPATADDIAIDAGGHLGDWTAQLICQYGCRVIVFEPVAEYCARIRERFARNARIKIVEAGLAAGNREVSFVLDGLASSAFPARKTGKSASVQLVDVGEVFAKNELVDVACMKMNIEGGEYELLERMLELNLTRVVRSYLIQFHATVPDHEARHQRIRVGLAKTHRLVFEYPHVWERWDAKPANAG